jgi:hypothetical protein
MTIYGVIATESELAGAGLQADSSISDSATMTMMLDGRMRGRF